MQFGIYPPNFGEFADPQALMSLAHEAEESGWDGFFLWDHIQWTSPHSEPLADPRIALTAMAVQTTRIRLGALVTPIARRRPSKLAREAVTLDHVSDGRLVFGAGIGGDWCQEYSAFGEPADARRHADMLDEGLEVITKLWQGEPVTHQGQHYTLNNVQFIPRPRQTPRIPIWIAGVWPRKRPFRRAAKWDGVFPIGRDGAMTPADYRSMVDYISEHRRSTGLFDVICGGSTSGDDRAADAAQVGAFAEAGVTWWLEQTTEERDSVDTIRARIRQGPPSI